MASTPLASPQTFQGWEFLRLGVGTDFALARNIRLGPFAEFSLAQFQVTSSAARPAFHFWFAIGVKLTWLP